MSIKDGERKQSLSTLRLSVMRLYTGHQQIYLAYDNKNNILNGKLVLAMI